MANTHIFQEIFAREMQDSFLKKSRAMIIAETSFKSQMRSGDTLARLYTSTTADDVPSVHTRGGDIPLTEINDTKETLTVNRQFVRRFTVDDFDAIQSEYALATRYGQDQSTVMMTQVDADVLWEVVNAESTVDAWDVGGSAGAGIALTIVNVLNVVTSVTKKLSLASVYDENRFGIVSPEFEEVVSLYYGAKATDLGDKVSQNGFFKNISGYDLHSSNNLTGKAVLGLATNPTAGDTITIEGQVFTFVSSIGTTAGNVLIAGTVDGTRANLATLINAPGTTTANGVALTGNALNSFIARASAVNDDTANTLTVTYKGAGTLVVSEILTDGTDTWTSQKQICVFGIKNKATCLIMQKAPTIEVSRAPQGIYDNVKSAMLYGTKTFRDNSKRMVAVELDSSGY